MYFLTATREAAPHKESWDISVRGCQKTPKTVLSLVQSDLWCYEAGLYSGWDAVRNGVDTMVKCINNSYLEGEQKGEGKSVIGK